MIPQHYPLYARIWTTDNPNPATAAIIGWTPDPDLPDAINLIPTVVILGGEGDQEIAFALTHHAWRWHITTNPDSNWTPTPAARS